MSDSQPFTQGSCNNEACSKGFSFTWEVTAKNLLIKPCKNYVMAFDDIFIYIYADMKRSLFWNKGQNKGVLGKLFLVAEQFFFFLV